MPMILMKLLDIRVEQTVKPMIQMMSVVGVMLVSWTFFLKKRFALSLLFSILFFLIGEDSICKDKVQSEFGRGLRDEWFNKNLYWSYNACDSSKKVETGNEQFLPETRLTSKNLPDEYGGGGFLANTPEECQTECYVRYDENKKLVFCPVHSFHF